MADDVDQGRRKFLTGVTWTTGAIGVAFAAVPFIASWQPSARARALGAPLDVDISTLEPGAMMTVYWRKEPIWIIRRTRDMIDRLDANDPNLKDPKSEESEQPPYAQNEVRARNPEYLVLRGTCTHLGCLPKTRFHVGVGEGGPDWPGGFFCVCHGSKFDMAGRVFIGSPAASNLRVPQYAFVDRMTIMLGVDEPPEKPKKQGVA